MDGEMTERNREQRTDSCRKRSALGGLHGAMMRERATAAANGGMETKLSRLAALFSVTIRF